MDAIRIGDMRTPGGEVGYTLSTLPRDWDIVQSHK